MTTDRKFTEEEMRRGREIPVFASKTHLNHQIELLANALENRVSEQSIAAIAKPICHALAYDKLAVAALTKEQLSICMRGFRIALQEKRR